MTARKIIIALLVVATGFSFSSCRKMDLRRDHKHNETTQYITINKTLAYGESYQLDLSPYEDKDDISSITQQANQYTISALSGQALTSDNAYTFRLDGASRKTTVLLPVSDTGNTPVNQQVILTVQEGAHAQQSGGCFGGGGSCGNSHENRTEAVITINFTVQ